MIKRYSTEEAFNVLMLLSASIILMTMFFVGIVKVDIEGVVFFGVPLNLVIFILPPVPVFLIMLNSKTRSFHYRISWEWAHLLTTTFALIGLSIFFLVGALSSEMLRSNYVMIGNAIRFLTLLFLFGQLIFFANILLGFIRRSKK